MGMRSTRIFFALFGALALASLTNVACSSPTDVDAGTTENGLTGRGAYGGYGTPAYEAYAVEAYFGGDLATDTAFAP